MTKRRIHEDEYMSSDIWKYNLDPPVYKRGSRHNKIGMWITVSYTHLTLPTTPYV